MNRFGSPSTPAALAVVALVLAACAPATSSATSAPSQAASVAPTASAAPSESEAVGDRVRLTGFAFEPAELTVAVGTEVSFVNADGTTHSVTEGESGTPVTDPIIDEELAQNASTRFVFDEPGTYQITCRFHSSMQMTITVEG